MVRFLGVLYHLKHPLLALERVHSVTGDQLVLETHAERALTRRPAMVFYPRGRTRGEHDHLAGPQRGGGRGHAPEPLGSAA